MSVGIGNFHNCKILLVDDETDFRATVQSALPKEVFMASAGNINEAKTLLDSDRFDMILLDLSLPDGDGLKFCSKIREDESYRNVPIILVTGRSAIDDKVMAFQLGADDYLVKPFDLREFKARILSRLRRMKEKSEDDQLFHIGNLKIVVPLQKVYFIQNNVSEEIEMTPLEFKLLLSLAMNDDRVFTRDELITRVWGPQVHVLDRTVDSHISDLRKKLHASTHTIRCLRGVGYQFIK